MADLAQFDIGTRSREARMRALLEDLVQEHMGFRPQHRMALAVWFQKSIASDEQYLLELMTGPSFEGFATDRFPLAWKAEANLPPFVNVKAASVDYFVKLATAYPEEVEIYRDKFEVLYSDKRLLVRPIIDMFNIITEPTGLVKGWYIPATQYSSVKTMRSLLSLYAHSKPEIGLIKTNERMDFEYTQGILNVEVQQKWVPLSADGIQAYSCYTDHLAGRAGYFLFEGGSVYQIVKFEVKTAPEYANRLLGRTSDDRYPEVYLRAVHQSSESAA